MGQVHRRTRATPDPLTHDQGESKDTMRLQKTVIVDKPLDAVFDYLSDFTATGYEKRVNSQFTVVQHRRTASSGRRRIRERAADEAGVS